MHLPATPYAGLSPFMAGLRTNGPESRVPSPENATGNRTSINDVGKCGMRTLFIKILTFVVAPVLAFDIISFWLLPAGYLLQFREYRRDSGPEVGGFADYPRYYFVRHPQRGFDIGTNRRTDHWVDGVTYPIWSNAIGCFDKEHTRYDPYVYFAGDSMTWGYTPFEQKFGTLIENMTGVRILKCGVTHTGQRHQYQKFIEIVEQIGRLPRALFVFYYWNDIANDYAHPHSTVIDGWQVNNVGSR